ncbi:hypothetical protein VT84_17030 [Gemmata sp. SH-PL17]|uniref:hypothetical protein n=1 Tax=Gemmata sp. SH-PL17 TaxID=1630693 RepID=UPI00078D1D33|nr:hypothetical protein [Gemmata sp. SH-PL17]AMV26105.1 hypothetical protein VT84_17030 [Gemmata sp. SH-PL17]
MVRLAQVATDSAPSSPPPCGDVDGIEALGEPFSTYAKLLLAFDDANRDHHVALINGTATERARAELRRDKCQADIVSFQHHRANALLMDLRFAKMWSPAALELYLYPAFRDQLASQEIRIKELEDALLQLASHVGAITKTRSS